MSYLNPFAAPLFSFNPFGTARVACFLAVFGAFCSTKTTAQDSLLNASYDVSRELYRDINASFAADWKAKTGRSIEIRQSHAGSSVQARAVIDGLEADVVTFNQVTDLDALVNAKLVSEDWPTKYPYNAPSNQRPKEVTNISLECCRQVRFNQSRRWFCRPDISVQSAPEATLESDTRATN